MATCKYCGSEVPYGAKTCANCGATLEAPKIRWIDIFSRFFGIILMIIAFVSAEIEQPALLIVVSVAIIVAAIFCLSQGYKLKGFTIVALILGIILLMTGVKDGKKHGFFKSEEKTDYTNVTREMTVQDTVPVVTKVAKPTPTPKTEPTATPEPTVAEEAEQEKAVEGTTEETEVVEEITPDVEEKEATDSVDGVTPEFKAAMDEYEKFYDDYCDFMKRYMNADATEMLSMLNDYTKMLDQLTKMDEELDKMDTSKMSLADQQYFIEVTARIEKKLLEAAYY